MFKELSTCSHVFVRTDAVRTSLQQPYEGPYQVVRRNDKYFTIVIRGKENTVSINRLKPCFAEVSDLPTNSNEDKSVSAGQDSELTNGDNTSDSDGTMKNRKNKHVTFDLNPDLRSEPIKTRTGRSVTLPRRFR